VRQQGEALSIEVGRWLQLPGIVDGDLPLLELGADIQRRVGTAPRSDVNGFLCTGQEVADFGLHLSGPFPAGPPGYWSGVKLNFCPPIEASYISPPLVSVKTAMPRFQAATPLVSPALAEAPLVEAPAWAP